MSDVVYNQADNAVRFALNAVGAPYKWGATGPDAYDCSGLVYAAYRSAGVTGISRTTYTQINQGTAIAIGQQRVGDLIFPDPGHVQIYVGNGKIVEAPSAGKTVRVVPTWGIMAVRRIVAPANNAYGTIDNSQSVAEQIVTANKIPAVTGTIQVIQGLDTVFSKLGNPKFMMRVGEVILGTLLLIFAILPLLRMNDAVDSYISSPLAESGS